MIKFKEKNNNINKLIDIAYKILNESYNNYISKKEKEKFKQQNNIKYNNFNIEQYLDLNDFFSHIEFK